MIVLSVEMKRHWFVVFRVGFFAERVTIELHETMHTRQMKRLVVALRHDKKLNGRSIVAKFLKETYFFVFKKE